MLKVYLMTYFIFIIFIIIIVLIVSKKLPIKDLPQIDEAWPFYSKTPLTKVEQVLYHRLVDALPSKIILSQVQLSRFLSVKKGHNFASWLNRINRMSIDYLICETDFSIIAAIELDDSSHSRQDRVKADDKKNKALHAARIKLIRWDVNNKPDVQRIQKDVLGQYSHSSVRPKSSLLL